MEGWECKSHERDRAYDTPDARRVQSLTLALLSQEDFRRGLGSAPDSYGVLPGLSDDIPSERAGFRL